MPLLTRFDTLTGAHFARAEIAAELDRPTPDGRGGDDDSALKQHFLDETQAQRKTEIEPDRVCDDLGGKSVAFVTRAVHVLTEAYPEFVR